MKTKKLEDYPGIEPGNCFTTIKPISLKQIIFNNLKI